MPVLRVDDNPFLSRFSLRQNESSHPDDINIKFISFFLQKKTPVVITPPSLACKKDEEKKRKRKREEQCV
jgi:hypothetical protein